MAVLEYGLLRIAEILRDDVFALIVLLVGGELLSVRGAVDL